MRLSVITPVLNASATLARTIDSVLSQKSAGTEYIIIDGGSIDGSQAIAKSFDADIDMLLSEPDEGIADAMNKGIYHAQGDYIGILNADDYYCPRTLSIISETTSVHDADVIYGDVEYLDPTSDLRMTRVANLDKVARFMSLYHPAMFIHKRAYHRIGVYLNHYRYAMDSNWGHRAVNARLHFLHVPHTLAVMSLGGVSHKHHYRALQEFRASSVTNKLSSSTEAIYFGYAQYLLHRLLKWKMFRSLWLAIKKPHHNGE